MFDSKEMKALIFMLVLVVGCSPEPASSPRSSIRPVKQTVSSPVSADNYAAIASNLRFSCSEDSAGVSNARSTSAVSSIWLSLHGEGLDFSEYVGLIDIKRKKNYYLRIGDSIDGVKIEPGRKYFINEDGKVEPEPDGDGLKPAP